MKFIVSSSVLLKHLPDNGKCGKLIAHILVNFLDEAKVDKLTISVDEVKLDSPFFKGVSARIRINEIKCNNFCDDIDRLILEIYKDNKLLHTTHHYDFEQIVRKVFIGLGYAVQPTKRTRDGGYDMIATQGGAVPTCHLIECKTRSKSPIGIELVERFLYKVGELKVSGGVMVSNLKFSADVIKKYATAAYKYCLKLIDGSEFLQMITSYVQRFFCFTLQQAF